MRRRILLACACVAGVVPTAFAQPDLTLSLGPAIDLAAGTGPP